LGRRENCFKADTALHKSPCKLARFKDAPLLARPLSHLVSFQKSSSLTPMAKYWLLKSEPEEYSIEDLEKQEVGQWDGIRNYQARNHLRDMKEGDVAFFYHSCCKVVGIYGAMTIVSPESYPDPTAVDPKSEYFDKRIKDDKNPWVSVKVAFRERYNVPLPLPKIQELPLGPCPLTARGNRLSVIPLTEKQYDIIKRELDILNEDVQD
jgi:predicted RNA-binding protein with PUA-like domain